MFLIADLILVIHFAVVIFISGGLLFVPVGYKLGCSWLANKRLRVIHSAAMAFVTLETVLGFTCPLTLIENYLGRMNGTESFVGYWIKRVFYYDFPVEYFAVLYLICLTWTILMWILFPPRSTGP